MELKKEFNALIDELNRVHSGAIPWSDEGCIPDFVTTENGSSRYFTRKAREALYVFSKTLHENRSSNSVKIELEEYIRIVRQAVADIHSADDFLGLDENDQQNILSKLKSLVEERLAAFATEFTHYFPAWTLGMESESPFILGPVTFLNRTDWIDSVDFPEQGKERYLNQTEANFRWKETLKEALLKRPEDASTIKGLASGVYKAIDECPALLKVVVLGYERNYSRKLARLVGKTALDAVSLGFGSPECFQQQTLQDERLPPYMSHSLIETNGSLWLPGSNLGKRIRPRSPEQVEKALLDIQPVLLAVGLILNGLIDPSKHKHPKLAMRWATALDWFGEGNRESSDAIAVAKLGTCLDVLSCGGKYVGIKEMVIHLTGISGDTVIVQNTHKTLAQVIKAIYDDGRSQILHGTHYDRLKSFETTRRQAAFLARITLIECALRLQSYQGPDGEKAFRSI